MSLDILVSFKMKAKGSYDYAQEMEDFLKKHGEEFFFKQVGEAVQGILEGLGSTIEDMACTFAPDAPASVH